MKRFIFITTVCLSLVLQGCHLASDENQGIARKDENSTYEVGCLTALTGENAQYGKYTKQGVDLAVEEINNSDLLDKPLKIIYEDDKMSAKDGINAFQKLIASKDVPVVIGPFGSSVVLSVAPEANKTKTIIISASATADGIKDAGEYVFRITPPNSQQGKDLAQFAFSGLGAIKAGILFQNNDYGVTLRDGFKTAFENLGGTIVGVESMDETSSDYRTQITKLKATNPDVVFFPLHSQPSALFVKQARELGLNVPLISADGAMTDDMKEVAGTAAENTYYSTLALGYGEADSLIASFNSAFVEKFGEEPNVYAAYYYEVTKLIAVVMSKTGYDVEKIKTELESGNEYSGITGVTKFDSNGEVDKRFRIYQYHEGEFSLLKN